MSRPAVRNFVAAALWQPRFKPQRVPDAKRKQQAKRPTKSSLRAQAQA